MKLSPMFSKLGKIILCSLLAFTLFVSNAAPSQAAQVTINKIQAETVSLGIPVPANWIGTINQVAQKVGSLGKGIPGPIGVVASVISQVPGGLELAKSFSQTFPDELYLSQVKKPDNKARFWPQGSKYVNLYPGPNKAISGPKLTFGASADIHFWEYDTISSDDYLGTLTVTASEAGQGPKSAVLSNPGEGNLYYVEYQVTP